MLTPASMSHLRHFSADRFFISSAANADPSACSTSPEPCAVTSPAASVAGGFSSPDMGTLSSCWSTLPHEEMAPREEDPGLSWSYGSQGPDRREPVPVPGVLCASSDDRQERPAVVHQYKRSGGFGATCDLCRIGTIWDSPERRDPGPCMGARS